MKKILLFIAFILPIIVLAACSKDKDEPFSLKGKTYAAYDYSTNFGELVLVYEVWKFAPTSFSGL